MQGYAAYAQVQPTNDSHRDLEYRVLGRVTGALIKASADGSTLSEVYDAALWNEKVWHVFRCESARGLKNRQHLDISTLR